MILKLKIFQRHDISPYHHQHQQTLQNLVDPMNNDVTVLQSDYQRIKKHTPTYQADFAGIFPNLLTNTISNTFDSDEEETISSGTLIDTAKETQSQIYYGHILSFAVSSLHKGYNRSFLYVRDHFFTSLFLKTFNLTTLFRARRVPWSHSK